MAGVVEHLDVEHRGQTAKSLGTDAERIDLFHQFEAQFFRAGQLGTGSGFGLQQQYFVYGRDGEPCRICGRPIRELRQGQRATFFCAGCQR